MRDYREAISRKTITIMIVVVSLCLVLGTSACQSAGDSTAESQEAAVSTGETPNEPDEAQSNQPGETSEDQAADDPIEVDQPEVDEASSSDPEIIQTSWGGSAHADTFILDETGNNNTCARCHAPIVWTPSMDDMPESCFACKFEVDDPPPLIAESDWVQIDCSVCHEVDKKGNVAPEYAWLEIAQIGEYAEVAAPSELCQKCHIESGLPGHVVAQVGGAHSGYECTDCHDAHDAAASCTSGGCHEDVLDAAAPIAGHDQDHEKVSCAACHDAGELSVDFDEEQGFWVTFANDPVEADQLIPLVSHNTVLEAPCDRCHYLDNPWGLSTEIE